MVSSARIATRSVDGFVARLRSYRLTRRRHCPDVVALLQLRHDVVEFLSRTTIEAGAESAVVRATAMWRMIEDEFGALKPALGVGPKE